MSLKGKVKLLTNLPPRPPDVPRCCSQLCKNPALSLHSCLEVTVLRKATSLKFCVAINYRHRGRRIWAYYHKASWEDISCSHYSAGSDRELLKMPAGFAFTPFVGPVVTPDRRRADRVCWLFLTTSVLC